MAETAPIKDMRRAKITRTELRNIEFYRRGSGTDDVRAEARSLKFGRFLMAYEMMRDKPGVWFSRDDIGKITGYSVRHSRRLIRLFQAIGHPCIEVEYAVRKPGIQSRMRWVQ